MTTLSTLPTSLGRLPLDYLIIFVALGALGLAYFAIHAVWSIAKERGSHK